MSALGFQKLVINNPIPTLNPCGPHSSSQTNGKRDLESGRQTGIIPYGDAQSKERDNATGWWKELMNNFGMRIKYWQHGYDLGKHDFVYGEHTTAEFEPDELILGMVEKAGESAMFSKFGFQGAAEMRVAIEIDEFYRIFGENSKPQSGDLFTMPDVYSDRPGGLGIKIFEVTFPDDDAVDSTFLGGHYVWMIDAIRWEPSYEDGAPEEPGGSPMSDDSPIGILPTFGNTPSKPKAYEQEIDEDVKENFDQEIDNGGRDSVYGEY